MKAIGFYQNLPVQQADALQEIELPIPTASGHDLLVEVKAVSVNPVDTKLRLGSAPPSGQAKVLGWDAAGVVSAVGELVTLFKPGDEVWYAGSITRPGSNAEYQLVDERIVGRKPANLSYGQAAALPLTALTAWELLFDRLQVSKLDCQVTAWELLHDRLPPNSEDHKASILVVGAAGGVGSILIQLLKQLTDLTIIATASRPESRDWLLQRGAHHVLDHSAAGKEQDMPAQLQRLGLPAVDYVIGLNKTEQHFAAMIEMLKPQGKLALIDDPELIDVRLLKKKSLSLHWELMFTRSLFGTADMIRQHEILNAVATMVEQGQIQSTVQQHLGRINAENLRRAHALIEQAQSIGKIVLEGF
ncbi:MAG: zinc-binding alcohol dehydrogenase family protein [Methylophilus sp.]|uniref:zinc-binding alcohol dehydrogenase family protein n=1 Tax=Methylophilus sp. TaxID=29541 RepID=UPI003FA1399B